MDEWLDVRCGDQLVTLCGAPLVIFFFGPFWALGDWYKLMSGCELRFCTAPGEVSPVSPLFSFSLASNEAEALVLMGGWDWACLLMT